MAWCVGRSVSLGRCQRFALCLFGYIIKNFSSGGAAGGVGGFRFTKCRGAVALVRVCCPWSGLPRVVLFMCTLAAGVGGLFFVAFGVRFPCAVFVLVNAIVNPTLYKVKPKLAIFLILCNLSSGLNRNSGFYGVNCTLYTKTQNPRKA